MRETRKPIGFLGSSAFAFGAFILGLPMLGAAPPKGSGDWKVIEALSDEFTGSTLDGKKWHDHNPHWKGRQPGYFSPKNVSVKDGELRLVTREESLPDLPEGYHSWTTAAVKSKALAHYGYFETRCRPMRSRASSAFWFYQAAKDHWTEIDVFEIAGSGKLASTLHMNAHVFRTPEEGDAHRAQPDAWEAPFDFADDYHVFGLLWDPMWLEWYVDGKLVRKMKNTDWHQPLHMNMDSETFPDWFGLPDPNELPATFVIDWVRAWKKE